MVGAGVVGAGVVGAGVVGVGVVGAGVVWVGVVSLTVPLQLARAVSKRITAKARPIVRFIKHLLKLMGEKSSWGSVPKREGVEAGERAQDQLDLLLRQILGEGQGKGVVVITPEIYVLIAV